MYRYGDREQAQLFPASIEDYVSDDAPVRAYDAMIEAMDFKSLGIEINPDRVGNPTYEPRSMLKLLVYGYSYGIRSSRKMEREINYNLSFIWLMGGLKPDHKTISEFRRNNKAAITNVLRQCVRLCVRLDLIDGNTLFVDGTKIRANASIKNSLDKKECADLLTQIDKRIETILSECERIDNQEASHGSLVKMKEEYKDEKRLRRGISNALNELREDKKSINTVDADCCGRMHSVHGAYAGYNLQSVVDGKNGLIVNTDVTSANNDIKQFAAQIEQAIDVLGKKCEVACADAGYAGIDELEKIDDKKITVVVPSAKQAEEKAEKDFDKEKFRYDAASDCYVCKEGRVLPYRYTHITKKAKIYRIKDPSNCRICRHFGVCTMDDRTGRSVTRYLNEGLREKFKRIYNQPKYQAIYKLRKQMVELPFGHIKHNLKMDAFLMRGREGTIAEAAILGTCFNIARMITILGVTGLIERLTG